MDETLQNRLEEMAAAFDVYQKAAEELVKIRDSIFPKDSVVTVRLSGDFCAHGIVMGRGTQPDKVRVLMESGGPYEYELAKISIYSGDCPRSWIKTHFAKKQLLPMDFARCAIECPIGWKCLRQVAKPHADERQVWIAPMPGEDCEYFVEVSK